MGKTAGSNGYFEFIEQYMGAEIKGKEMNFSVLAKKINAVIILNF